MGVWIGRIRNTMVKGWVLVLASATILFVVAFLAPMERVEDIVGTRTILLIGSTLGFIMGISIIRSLECLENISFNEPSDSVSSSNRWEMITSGLEGDEKELYLDIVGCGGAILQNDLCDQTGFSRSKISRLLAKMEVRGLVERRRNGMTNLVVLR